jgi:hypothetical protein
MVRLLFRGKKREAPAASPQETAPPAAAAGYGDVPMSAPPVTPVTNSGGNAER